MQKIDREQLSHLLKEQRIKPRLVRELRFMPEEVLDWDELEMLAIPTRSNLEGLLIIQTSDFYMLPYTLMTSITDKLTGRSKPVTCDFCYTWQAGGKAGRITFRRPTDDHLFTYLCCRDLRCSLHVRTMTAEAILSRTQLHEDMTTKERVTRLERKLSTLVETLNWTAI